jgi:hypothetical protein
MILDYFIKQKDLYKTFLIISIVNSIIIINSHLYKDYFNKDKDKNKNIFSILYFIHIITIFITTFIISFVSYIMCFYLFGYKTS